MNTAIETYLLQFPMEQQARMRQLYEIIKTCCPEAEEKISWGMPTFIYYGNLVHFAQHKHHLGFYPGESGVSKWIKELNLHAFNYSKGAIQFPNHIELPLILIKSIVLQRTKENLDAHTKKKEKR